MECCPGALNRQISLNISLEASKCEKPETAQPVQRSSTYVRLTHQCSRKKCKGIVLVVEAAMLSAVDGHCNAGCSSPSEFSEASFSCCVEVKRHPCPRHCRQGAKFAHVASKRRSLGCSDESMRAKSYPRHASPMSMLAESSGGGASEDERLLWSGHLRIMCTCKRAVRMSELSFRCNRLRLQVCWAPSAVHRRHVAARDTVGSLGVRFAELRVRGCRWPEDDAEAARRHKEAVPRLHQKDGCLRSHEVCTVAL